MVDHYDCLGVTRTATIDEIEISYRKIMLDNHTGCVVQLFLNSQELAFYPITSEERRKYDKTLLLAEPRPPSPTVSTDPDELQCFSCENDKWSYQIKIASCLPVISKPALEHENNILVFSIKVERYRNLRDVLANVYPRGPPEEILIRRAPRKGIRAGVVLKATNKGTTLTVSLSVHYVDPKRVQPFWGSCTLPFTTHISIFAHMQRWSYHDQFATSLEVLEFRRP
ncbi:hypothetical protein EJ04DRAFT_528932 [Polyplosphaeria fusca]|uniref:J domain-containing protein n=1 Tax=Polyplosphaeria fusca TaxID=682080 RepID=A0A9P4QIR0_9PLEO|nr:hypothetical protein EJ04DRAFT_528932 [Polyplosphaeria fusca]